MWILLTNFSSSFSKTVNSTKNKMKCKIERVKKKKTAVDTNRNVYIYETSQ